MSHCSLRRHVGFMQELAVEKAEAALLEFAGYHKLGELGKGKVRGS